MRIPWAKLHLGPEELEEVISTVKSGWLSQGPRVKALEERLASYVGVTQTVAVNNGTSALDIALKVLEVQPGDEVIVPASTYIATANAVLYQHATPVFADIEMRTYNIDPNDVVRKITKKTKALIVIDYGGQSADYDQLTKIAADHKLAFIEDGAPGLGGSYRGRKLCSFGHMATTSFHIAKVFSSIEGGMIFTNSAEYAEKCRIIRSQGEDPKQKYVFPLLGHNYRMSDLHAAIGLAQTTAARMEMILGWRRKNAEYYSKCLEGVSGVVLPEVLPENTHAWFLYPILISLRDEVRAFMLENGIETNVSWPRPVYAQKPYETYKAPACPVAEDFTKRVLCLPMFYGLSEKEQDYIVDTLIKGLKRFQGGV